MNCFERNVWTNTRYTRTKSVILLSIRKNNWCATYVALKNMFSFEFQMWNAAFAQSERASALVYELVGCASTLHLIVELARQPVRNYAASKPVQSITNSWLLHTVGLSQHSRDSNSEVIVAQNECGQWTANRRNSSETVLWSAAGAPDSLIDRSMIAIVHIYGI